MKAGGSFLFEPVVGKIFTREDFSEEQREIDRTVREFASAKIAPRKAELAHHNKELTLELMREVAEMGLTGVDIPEKYGGVELDKTTSALVAEALTTGHSASWVVTFSAHVGIGSLPIVFFGTEDQKERYLPRLAAVDSLAAYALTEPQAGSDAANLRTTATLSDDGESFILNGAKQYVTNGGWADVYIVFAKLDGAMTAFVVERGSPGFTVGEEEDKMGIRGSSTTSLHFDNVSVPKRNLLGKPGEGLEIALNILNVGRFKLGAADLGGCKTAINHVTSYALERRQFGQPVAYFDAIRKKLADMVVRTFALDSAIYRTVGLMDERIAALDPGSPDYNRRMMAALEEYAIENSIAKILGSETISKVADQGLQVFGGYGFSEEYPMASMYRDCRIDRLFEGTNEINRMVVYGYFLKKALMEELPLREAEKAWGSPTNGDPHWGVGALDAGRRLTVKCLHQAICLYGQDFRNEQIVGEDVADLAIGYYAASSALNRILQHSGNGTRKTSERALSRLLVASYLEDAWRILFRLRPTLFSDPRSPEASETFDRLTQELHLPFDPVEEIRVLTDDLYHHGHYRFE